MTIVRQISRVGVLVVAPAAVVLAVAGGCAGTPPAANSCGGGCSTNHECRDGACVCPSDKVEECGGSCVDVHGVDSQNCGACGSVCSGKCMAGRCFERLDEGPAAINYWAFAISEKRVIWVESPLLGGKGTINSVPKSGGVPTKLAGVSEASSTAIAARVGRVFWVGCEPNATVFSTAEVGGNVTFPDPQAPIGCTGGLVFDDYGTALYFMSPEANAWLVRMDSNENPSEVVVSAEPRPFSLVADGTDSYWVSTPGIRTIASYSGTTPPRTIAGPVERPAVITVSGGFVYYASPGTLARVPVGGGAPQYVVGSGPAEVRGFIRDGARIFVRGAVGGGFIDTTTNTITPISMTAGALVGVDDSYVYAALPNYGIFRVKKSDLP